MDKTTYQKSAMATLNPKPAKLAMKLVSRNQKLTNVMHACAGLSGSTGILLGTMNEYLHGRWQIDKLNMAEVRQGFAGIGYYLVLAAKHLKVKLPTSTRKIKQKGTTICSNVLELVRVINEMQVLVTSLYDGPTMNTVTKTFTVPVKDASGAVTGKSQVAKDVEVPDLPAWKASLEEETYAMLSALLVTAVGHYWTAHLAVFGEPPATTFEYHRAKLAEVRGVEFFAEIDKPKAKKVAPAKTAA